MSGSGGHSEQGMWRVRGPGDKSNPFKKQKFSTGFSTINGGNVTIDPSIRAIQEQNLSRSNNLYNDLGSQAVGLMGNQSDYIRARVSPLEQEYNMRQGAQERNLSLRGLSGSSFGEMDRTNLASAKERDLGNARALATQDSLSELARVRAQQAQAIGMDAQTARDRFAQELSALGIGQGNIQQLFNMYEQEFTRQGGFQPYQSGHSGQGGGGAVGGGGGGGGAT